MAAGLEQGFETASHSLRKNPIRQRGCCLFGRIVIPRDGVTNDPGTIPGRKQPFNLDLAVIIDRMDGNRSITSSTDPMQKRPFSEDRHGSASMMEGCDQGTNDWIVFPNLKCQSSLSECGQHFIKAQPGAYLAT